MEYDDYKFPASIEAVGWIMEMLPLIIVLLYPIIPLYKVEGANKEIFITLTGLSIKKSLAQLMFSRKKRIPNFTNVSQLKKKYVVYYLHQKAFFLSFEQLKKNFMTNIMYVLYLSETEKHWWYWDLCFFREKMS